LQPASWQISIRTSPQPSPPQPTSPPPPQVIVDIRWYLVFIMFIMWGFAGAFMVLFRKDQQHPEFATIGSSMLTVFGYALGGTDLQLMQNSHNPTAAFLLTLTYQFAMVMVLMNLLVGIMTNSITKVRGRQAGRQQQGQGHVCGGTCAGASPTAAGAGDGVAWVHAAAGPLAHGTVPACRKRATRHHQACTSNTAHHLPHTCVIICASY
jgi:hypothetical protein